MWGGARRGLWWGESVNCRDWGSDSRTGKKFVQKYWCFLYWFQSKFHDFQIITFCFIFVTRNVILNICWINYFSCIHYITAALTTSQLHTLHHRCTYYITAAHTTSQMHLLHHGRIHYITAALTTSQLHALHHSCTHYITSALTISQLHSLHNSNNHYITVALTTSQLHSVHLSCTL